MTLSSPGTDSLEYLASTEAQRQKMLLPGDCVLAGLSGGADSVALLHWLCSVKEEYGLAIAAAHLNHGLRGAASDGDEAFCGEICAAWGLPLHTRRANIAEEAKQQGIGMEEAGRRARYAFFEDRARAIGASKIALAHTLSDRIETFLLNFGRGTALRGLCSIPPTRPITVNCQLIRPLISCSRAQIEAYCALHGLAYRTDASNGDDRYRRNAIRQNVLPPLKEALPGLENAARRLFPTLEADEDYLAAEADKLFGASQVRAGEWDAHMLAEAHPALLGRVLRRAVAEAGHDPAFCQIGELSKILPGDCCVNLSDTLRLRCRRGVLRLESHDAPPRKRGIHEKFT